MQLPLSEIANEIRRFPRGADPNAAKTIAWDTEDQAADLRGQLGGAGQRPFPLPNRQPRSALSGELKPLVLL
jgi:hypothetical protein